MQRESEVTFEENFERSNNHVYPMVEVWVVLNLFLGLDDIKRKGRSHATCGNIEVDS